MPHKLLAGWRQLVYEGAMTKGINIHIYPSDITSESRMMKITASLMDWGYFSQIWLIGILSEKTEARQKIDDVRMIFRFPRGIGIVRGALLRKLMATLKWSWAVWDFLRGEDVRVINCHSLPVLPLCVALKLRHGAVLIYDTHELETETTESRGLRRVFAKLLERVLIRFCDLTIVVGKMIAEWYARAYRMEKPVVIRNIPTLCTPSPLGGEGRDEGTHPRFSPVEGTLTPTLSPAGRGSRVASPLRAKLGLGEDAIIVLYLGKLSENRGIERLLHLFSGLEKQVHLVFMGDGSLTEMIKRFGESHPTIHWLPPVPMAEVVAHARGADMGVSVIDHSCLSYTYAMPNKFFEYLQAGVPILIGNMPEQREIVDANKVGWVLSADDATARRFLNGLTREDITIKQENTAAISHLYTWERERETLRLAYEKLRNKHPEKF